MTFLYLKDPSLGPGDRFYKASTSGAFFHEIIRIEPRDNGYQSIVTHPVFQGVVDYTSEEWWTRRVLKSDPASAAPNDNVAHALMLLFINQGRYAMTAAAIRRLVFIVSGREHDAGSQWTQGFRRQIDRLWTAKDQPKVQGRETYVLTQAGTERYLDDVSTRGWSADAYDALGLLDDRRERAMRRAEIYVADEVAV